MYIVRILLLILSLHFLIELTTETMHHNCLENCQNSLLAASSNPYSKEISYTINQPLSNSLTTPVDQAISSSLKSSASQTATNNALSGIYYGNQGWEMEDIKALEQWQGKKHTIVELFTNWDSEPHVSDNLFKQQLPNIWNNQNVPLITWEPYVQGTTPNDIEVQIANGDYDAYINNWAEQIKTFLSGNDGIYNTQDDRRAYLRLAHEMNGDWYPWSAAMGNNSPADYVRMWQHTKTIFDSKGLDAKHLQWVWCVSHNDIGGYEAEAFYPGDAYVDWVAIDGYNWGAAQSWSNWQTPDHVFGSMIKRLRGMTYKPIAITEVGSTTLTETGVNVAAKSQWVTDFYQYAVNQNIKMTIWFNEDKETDWTIFGGQHGDQAFQHDQKEYKHNPFVNLEVLPVNKYPCFRSLITAIRDTIHNLYVNDWHLSSPIQFTFCQNLAL